MKVVTGVFIPKRSTCPTQPSACFNFNKSASLSRRYGSLFSLIAAGRDSESCKRVFNTALSFSVRADAEETDFYEDDLHNPRHY